MANIDPAPSWADIRQLETTDRNLAGPGGVLNTQPTSIAARLNLLRNNATALNNTVAGVSSRQDAADSAIASLESQVLDAPGTLSDLDHGAAISVSGDQFPDVLSIDNSRGPVLALNESITDLAQRDEYLKDQVVTTGQTLSDLTSALGTAAYSQVSDFATASQGTTADQTATAVVVLDGRVTTLEAGQSSNALYFPSKTEMDATPGTFTNQGAFVTGGEGAGQYAWSGTSWIFLRADFLAETVTKEELASVAGVRVPTTTADALWLERDPITQDVCGRLTTTGRYEFLRTGFRDYEISAVGEVAKITGRANFHDVYTEYAADLTGTPYANALSIDKDANDRIARIVWADGRVEQTPLTSGNAAKLVNIFTMPNGAVAPNPNGGFTCTGANKLISGAYTSCWLVANYGSPTEGSSGNTPTMVILSPDMRYIVRELPLFSGVQVQGITHDTSDDSVWYVDKTNGVIRHVDLAGVELPGAITVGFTLNGLAYNAAEDSLFVPSEGTPNMYVYSCATGGLLRTVVGIDPGLDQIYYEPATNRVWGGVGFNGSDGRVLIYEATSGSLQNSFTVTGSQAIEGIWWDGRLLTIFNDGAYHTAAKPPLSMACQYEIS